MTGAGLPDPEELSPARRALFDRLLAERALSWAGHDGAPPSAPVLLRAGSGPTAVLLVHPVGGSLFCYAPLVAALEPGPPVYGFASTPGDHETVADQGSTEGCLVMMAARYRSGLRSAGLAPSWVLCGWSFGGVVAYEMARQAKEVAEGEYPVVLLDAAFVQPEEPGWSEAALRSRFLHDLVRLIGGGSGADEGRGVSRAEVIARACLHTGLTKTEVIERYGVFRANAMALASYHPRPYDGPVTLVLAERSPDVTPAWQRLVSTPIRRHSVPGDHYDVLTGGAVADIAHIVSDIVGRPRGIGASAATT